PAPLERPEAVPRRVCHGSSLRLVRALARSTQLAARVGAPLARTDRVVLPLEALFGIRRQRGPKHN
ncbi:MAG: hypothetical protein ACRDGB_14035, partial [Candidatus Limnocylindria bacterium]